MVYIASSTKLIPLLQPQHGFCQQNGRELGQIWASYVNKRWWWSLFAWLVDVVLQQARMLHRINNDEGDESLSLLAFRSDVVNAIFLKYSKEGRSSPRHVGIRNVPSNVRYDDTKHYIVQSEKQGRCKMCKKNSQRRCIKCKVNVHDIYLEIFYGY